jgi:hypothetical protein
MLHTMDESWSNEDLNDDGPSFHKYLHMWPWWHDAPIRKFEQKKLPCNFCMLDKKQERINYFKWMNTSISFGEPNVVEVNLRWWKNKFLQYSHIQTMPHTKGAPWQRYTIQLYVYSVIHFMLKVIVWVLHYKNIEGLSTW